MRALWLLILLLTLAGASPAALAAAVQAPPADTSIPAAPAETGPSPAALTSAEAATLRAIMDDPQKRARLAAALQAVAPVPPALPQIAPPSNRAVVAPAIPAAKPALPMTPAALTAAIAAATGAPPAPIAPPLAPDSVGAQAIAQAAAFMGSFSQRLTAVEQQFHGIGASVSYFSDTFADPARRTAFAGSFLRAGAALGVTVAVDLAMSLLLHVPRRWLGRRAPQAVQPGQKWLSRVRRRLRLLALGIVDFMLVMLAIAAGTSAGLGAIPMLGDLPTSAVESLVLAYTASRLAAAMVAFVVAPGAPRLRLVALSDSAAIYAVRAVRNVCLIGAIGFSAVELASQNGLPAVAEAGLSKLVLLAVDLAVVVIISHCRDAVARFIRYGADGEKLGGRVRFALARIWHIAAIFFVIGFWASYALQLRNGMWRIVWLFAGTTLVLLASQLVKQRTLATLDRALTGSINFAGFGFDVEARLRRWQPVLRGFINALAVVLGIIAIAAVWGYDVRAAFGTHALGGRLAGASTTVVLTAFAGILIYETVNGTIERNIAAFMRNGEFASAARLRTFLPILRTLLTFLLGAMFLFTALQEIGINTAPILAGAGIIGVAIGFGSQKLVQDFITGIFLLLENAMQVGDWVTVAGLAGTVEALSIRTMRLRALDGSVHIIPFSAVSTVTNVHRGVGNAAVSVSVPMETDLDQVFTMLRDIAASMREDPGFADLIRADLNLYGVDRVEAGVATITGQISCSDTGRLPVQREFNRRMAKRMADAAIRISAPVQTVVTLGVPFITSTPP